MTEPWQQEDGTCRECGVGFEQAEKHVQYIVEHTKRLIAQAQRNRWARVQEQVEQRRLVG